MKISWNAELVGKPFKLLLDRCADVSCISTEAVTEEMRNGAQAGLSRFRRNDKVSDVARSAPRLPGS